MKQCYLCGREADTQDHIPPKSFFPKPFPPNLLTVPCCTLCNNGFSQLDEQMRIFLAAEEHCNNTAKQIALQKIFTANSVKGKPFRAVASSLKTIPVQRTCFGDGVLDFLHQRADGGAGFIISFYRGATFTSTYSMKPLPL